MMMLLMDKIALALANALALPEAEIRPLLEYPPNEELGDAAFPCFTLARTMKQSPANIAALLEPLLIDASWSVQAAGPYLNFKWNRELTAAQLIADWESGSLMQAAMGNGERVIIDMSSPNIAKPFGIGHLRSTMIGNALYHILRKVGYETVSVNHLGDWGTQFGKMITAYLKWGDEQQLAADPIKGYLELYVRFHEEAEQHPELEDEARGWFVKLEAGDAEAIRCWSQFIADSLKEFNKLYDRLGVSFDHFLGESFYNDKMDAVVQQLQEQQLLEESEGAQVVRLDEHELPPCLIRKSDGTSIYATRDLATAIYRYEEMKGSELLYVVGSEQSLHFRQLFLVLEKMGFAWAAACKHIPFGLMKLDGQKMSTRRGKVVFLEEVLDEAVQRALQKIEEKNPALAGKAAVAEAVGIGAVVFGDLKNTRMLAVDFVLEDVLNFEGETGPYVQYAYARTQRILAKAAGSDVAAAPQPADYEYVTGDYAWLLMKMLLRYTAALGDAAKRHEPSILARYLIQLAQAFNRFYHHDKVLAGDAGERIVKLKLVQIAADVLKEGLELLGLKTPKEI
ncbi:arginine--tRNA ligase [Paenibacillus sp. FSL H8-0537]|uniref:arginine--tRNA ligase n=1 Tax=Paenibacillus sp. FSL H8-0537 TaxID=2921399 RepID=UPI0031010150